MYHHSPSNKISPNSKLKLPLLGSEIFYPLSNIPKNLETAFNWRQIMEGKDHVQIQGSELKHQRPLITELPDIKAV